MELPDALLSMGVAGAIGLLVGLQREISQSAIAGIRTFAIVSMFGAVAAMLSQVFGGWVVGAGLLGVAVLCYVGNINRPTPDQSPGVTTEAALLLIYGVGAMAVIGPREGAVAIGASLAMLLYLKPALSGFARRLSPQDLRAILQFAAMTLVILPVVPDRAFGPYGVLNPRHIWLMVVLVSGISLAGYVAHRMLGHRGGLALAGALGGLVSSTAATASLARLSAQSPGIGAARVGVMLATSVLYIRLGVEVYVVAPGLAPVFLPIILAMLGAAGLSVTLALMLDGRNPAPTNPDLIATNPAEIRPALVFAGVYGAVTLGAAWASDRFGSTGAYLVAGLSGLTDMDAITLSNARLAGAGTLEPRVAITSIVLAMISNLLFKSGLAGALGGWRFLRGLIALVLIQVLCGFAIVLWWPGLGLLTR